MGCVTFFDSMNPSALEDRSIFSMRTDSNDAMASLSRYLKLNQGLRRLRIIDRDSTASDPGLWNLLTKVLGLHESIEELCVNPPRDFEGKVASLFADVMRLNHHIKLLCIPVVGLGELQVIASVLESPTCAIEEINVLDRSKTSQDVQPINLIAMDALRVNRSIKRFNYFAIEDDGDKVDWQSVSELICNKTSIVETYNSNHVLEYLSIDGEEDEMPIDIYSLLHLNTNRNKHAVARQKNIRNRVFDDVDFVHRHCQRCWPG